METRSRDLRKKSFPFPHLTPTPPKTFNMGENDNNKFSHMVGYLGGAGQTWHIMVSPATVQAELEGDRDTLYLAF